MEQSESGKAELMLDTPTLIKWVIGALAARAWQSMGLVADPATGEVKKDLQDAQLAVDAVGLLVPLLVGRVPSEDSRQIQALLADLRINFVRQGEAGNQQG